MRINERAVCQARQLCSRQTRAIGAPPKRVVLLLNVGQPGARTELGDSLCSLAHGAAPSWQSCSQMSASSTAPRLSCPLVQAGYLAGWPIEPASNETTTARSAVQTSPSARGTHIPAARPNTSIERTAALNVSYWRRRRRLAHSAASSLRQHTMRARDPADRKRRRALLCWRRLASSRGSVSISRELCVCVCVWSAQNTAPPVCLPPLPVSRPLAKSSRV